MENFWSTAISNIKKEKKEFEEKFTDVSKENILLPKSHKIKYLIIGLNFLVENPQASWKIPSPLVGQAPARK